MDTVEITLKLSQAEALVLFEMLARLDSEQSIPLADRAEQRVLWRLEGQLENALIEPLDPNYHQLVAEARHAVRETVDWSETQLLRQTLMPTSYTYLQTLLGDYFHQDWFHDDPDPMGIVARFMSGESPETVEQAAKELKELLRSSSEEDLRRILFSEMRSYYDPSVIGKSVSTWLHEVARVLESGDPGGG
jgi:hypothetical protein